MFIFSNLATSLDGKISPARVSDFVPLGTDADRDEMLRLRGQCQAILMGASTLRAYRKPCFGPKDQTPQPLNVVLSGTLDGLSPDWSFFKSSRIHRLILAGPLAPAARMRKLASYAEIVQLKKPTPRLSTAAQVVRALETRGIGRLLIEGGGSVMWEFVSQGLIEEFHVTLTPRLVGGVDAPTLIEGKGFGPGQLPTLKLVQCRVVGDELFLTYRRTST